MSFPTHYIKKRDLLHSEKTSKETLSATAREFMAAERYSDALDFFEKARDTGGLNEIKQYALKAGDAFLIARLERFDKTLISRPDWDAVAGAATKGERPSFAALAAKKSAPPEAAVAEAKVVLPGSAPLSEN